MRYVIGTEVPVPGGATKHEDHVSMTKVENVQETIEVTRKALLNLGPEDAWDRVIAVVVQPGVEFGDAFVLPYQPNDARELSNFIETQPLIFEAHSTDYQTGQTLKNLVRDHFAILKVGPALTYAFREGIFALAMMENELIPTNERSNIVSVLDDIMVEHPEHWIKYYHGDEREQTFKRKYSLSDRIRYYWNVPRVQQAFERLLDGLGQNLLPATLLEQFTPDVYASVDEATPEQVLLTKIQFVLDNYADACNMVS